MNDRNYSISVLANVFEDAKTGIRRLNMVRITECRRLTSFGDLVRCVTNDLRYPVEQVQKFDTFGFSLSEFASSDRSITQKNGRTLLQHGQWRVSDAEQDSLSAFYCDVDNANDDQPIITVREIAERLDQLGLSWFAYTTYSHSEGQPKVRVIIDTNRPMRRAELLRLAVLLDWQVFGGQLDLSIYDPGDFLFAPPFRCETIERFDGVPLDVDRGLAEIAALQITTPACWIRAIKQEQPVPRSRSIPHNSSLHAASIDLSIRGEVSIDNPRFYNPAWATLYRDRVAGSHWETMRSLLGMVWVKSRGTLTHGEMRKVMAEIDATSDDHFAQQHGQAKAVELIEFIMSCEVPQIDDRCSLVEQEEAGLTILVKEAECGQGKTRDELLRMAHEHGRYVYAVDKVENMTKRKEEFFAIAGDDAVRFFIREAHSQYPLRVPLQLANIRNDLDRLKTSASAIVFVTQQTAAQMDWSGWCDFEIIIDEVPDCFQLFRIQAGHHVDLLRRHLKVIQTDGNCYALAATTEGLALARRTDIDDYEKVHHGLCVLLARPNNYVWVKQGGWDAVDSGGTLDFFALTSPLNLLPFKAVRLLGDEAMRSITVRAWREKWGVDFESIDFARRTRVVPTAERITIKYLSDHRDSSITRFQEGDLPLEKMTEWIEADSRDMPVLWTANERLKVKSGLPQVDYIPPKAHGRNDLDHYRRVAWLAAMKASKFEIATLRQICGMTAQELIDWREFNAMYQFVMRGIIRNFDLNELMTIYVFSRKQAEYLHRRLGGVMEKIDGIIVDRPARSVDEDGAMTAAERQKVRYWRDKMAKAGVADVRDLPNGSTLSDREARLVNRTHKGLLVLR